MKINFTKKEYLLLLDILYMADWVLNAHREADEKEDTREYEKLEQKILSYAKKMGMEKYVDFDPEYDMYFHSRFFEETRRAQEFIDEFENDCFWEELIDRLTRRDFLKSFSEEEIKEMDPYTRFERLLELSEKYSDEFEKNGLKNLVVKKAS